MPHKHAILIGASGLAGALTLAYVFKMVLRRGKPGRSKGDRPATTARTASRQGTRSRLTAPQAQSGASAEPSTSAKPRQLKSPRTASASGRSTASTAAAAPRPVETAGRATTPSALSGAHRIVVKRRVAKLPEAPRTGPGERQPKEPLKGPSETSNAAVKQSPAPGTSTEPATSATDQTLVRKISSQAAETASTERARLSPSHESSAPETKEEQQEQQQCGSALSKPAATAGGEGIKPGAVAAIAAEVAAAKTGQSRRGPDEHASPAGAAPTGTTPKEQDAAPQLKNAAAAGAFSSSNSGAQPHPADDSSMSSPLPSAALTTPTEAPAESDMPAEADMPAEPAVTTGTTGLTRSATPSTAATAEAEKAGAPRMLDAAPSAQQAAVQKPAVQDTAALLSTEQNPEALVPAAAAVENQAQDIAAAADCAAPRAVGDAEASAAAGAATTGGGQAETGSAAPAVQLAVTGSQAEQGGRAATELTVADSAAADSGVKAARGAGAAADVDTAVSGAVPSADTTGAASGAYLAANPWTAAAAASEPQAAAAASYAAKGEAPAAPDAAARTIPDTPPKRVSLSPAVHATEAARQRTNRSSSSSSSSRAGGSSVSRSGSGGGSTKMTVADIIRESIKLKKSNQRLKQQLNIQSDHKDTGPSSSSSRRSAPAQAAKPSSDLKTSVSDTAAAARSSMTDTEDINQLDQATQIPGAAAAAAGKAAGMSPNSTADSDGTSVRDNPVASHAGTIATTAPVAAAEEEEEGTKNGPTDATAATDARASAASGAPGNSTGAGGKEARAGGGRTGSSGSSGSSDQLPSLSPADLVRELRSMKTENLELVKMLAAQLQEVRAQNAELMAAFHRGGPSLAAVQEETEGSGTKGNDGTSTPTTGSELGTFKDRLRVPGLVRAGSITIGSDAGSSMRSAPVGGVNNTPTKTGGLWRWATGGRRLGGAMTADNMSVGDNVSIPDTLASPRSNMSIPVETLVDLLDGWGAR